jgi:hypothetical protein
MRARQTGDQPPPEERKYQMIRRFLTMVLAGVVLVLGSVALQPLPRANAAPEVPETVGHNSHGTHWAWVCLSVRPSEGPDIEHSHVYYMAEDGSHVRVFCQGDTPSGLRECTWHAIEWDNGSVTGPYGPTPYCELNTDGAADLQMFRAAPARPIHTPNAYGNWACGATRLHSYDFVGHAVPYHIEPAYIAAYCRGGRFDGSTDIQWYAILWWNGQTSVIGGSEGWHFCYLGEFCSPEP